MTTTLLRALAAKLSTRLFLLIAACALVASIFGVTAYMQKDAPQTSNAPVQAQVVLPAEIVNKEEKAAQQDADVAQEVSIAPNAISATTYPFTFSGGATLDDMSSGTTTLVSAAVFAGIDDDPSIVSNIGFDFWFNGVRYTQFSCNANGLCRLGATGVSNAFTNSIASSSDNPKIAPYWDDISIGTNGKVHYKVVGTAPSRKLVVEWQNMNIPRSVGSTGAATFQMWLYETSGKLEFVYGAGIVTGTSYSLGIADSSTVFASVTPSASPTVSYTTASDSNTFAIPSGTKYTFTPVTPSDPTSLTFTGTKATTTTLNWTDNSSNELGFAIYRSDDGGTTYRFINQTAANATTSIQTGLSPNTTYFWRVFAVTEGSLSNNPAAASVTTNSAGSGAITSVATGNWNSTATWSSGTVPTASDEVIIANGNTVTVDTAAVCASLTVGQGTSGVLQFDSTTARTLTVGGEVIINSGATLQSATTGTVTTHTLSVGGNLTNNGTLDLSTNTNTAAAGLTFTGILNTTFSGTGATTDLRTLTINKGNSTASTLEITTSNLTVQGTTTDGTPMAFLTLTAGTLKVSGTFTLTGRVFTAAGYTIGAGAGFWLNNPNFTVAGQNGSPTLTGLLRISNGTFNVGSATNSVNISSGGAFTIEGGAFNTVARLAVATSTNAVNYTQTGGTITVSTAAAGNTSTSFACFDLGTGGGTSATMSGGSIVHQNNGTGASGPRDYRNLGGIQSITGGTVQFGNASSGAAKTYNLQGFVPNLVISNASAGHTVQLQNLTVASGSTTVNNTTTLSANGFTFFQQGSTVTNNGAITGTVASSRFDFTGTAAQTYGGSGTFGTAAAPFVGTGVGIANTSGVTLNAPIVTTRVNLFTGTFSNSTQITIGNGGTSTGFIQRGGSAPSAAGSFDVAPTFNVGTGGLTISYFGAGNAVTTSNEIPSGRSIANLVVNSSPGVTLSGGGLTITSTLTLTLGNFTTSAANLPTVTNTATGGISGGSATSYVNGPLARVLPASLATGSTYTFPIGKGSFNLFELVNPTTNVGGTVTVQAEDFDANAGGTPGTGMASLNTNRYWQSSITAGAGNLTNTTVRLTDSTIVATSKIGQSATQTGAYNNIGGTVVGSTILSNSITSLGFFVIGTPLNDDIQATAFIDPTNGGIKLAGVSFSPQASFTNGGLNAETNVPVRYRIIDSTATEVYNQTASIASLAAGATTTVTFSAANLSAGAYTIKARSELAGDQAPSNDEISGTLTVEAPLSGTYTVGVGGNFTTLTQAISKLSQVGVSGPVTFSLTDSTYSASETFPLTINAFTGASASNTVTIKPASGVTATITGSSTTSILKLNGADFVTVEGSNNGTSTRNLTIANTNTGTSSAVIWLSSPTASDGATGNTIKNCNINGNASTTTLMGIFSGGTSISITGNALAANSSNIIQNNAIAKAQYGIYLIGTSTTTLDASNQVLNNALGTSTAGNGFQIAGIIAKFQTGAMISGNDVQNVVGSTGITDLGGTTIMSGIDLENVKASTVAANKVHFINYTGTSTNKVFALNTENTTFNSSGNPSANTFVNNAVYDIVSGGTSGLWNTSGINNNGGFGDKYYFNSVYLTGAMSGSSGTGPSAAFSNGNGITSANSANIDVRDNIFDMAGSSTSTPKLYAHYTTATTYAGSTLDYNDLLSSASGSATAQLGFFNSADRTDLAAWRTATGQEANSISTNPQFNSTTNLQPQLGSPVLGAGTPITGFTTDITGATRNATNPSIGAYENGADTAGPSITYTPLGNTTSTSDRTLTATITDPSGVAGGANAPRIYFRKNGGSYFSTQCTGSSPTYNCATDYSLVGGVTTGDVISYFVVAQDTPGNVSANPSAGFVGTSVNNVTTPPTTPNSYSILASISGTFNVGAGQTYTTLTAAINALNNSVLTGPVKFILTDSSYSTATGETFPLTINANGGSSSTNTVTIKPATGLNPVVTGSSSTAVLILNGADWVIIDGLNTGGSSPDDAKASAAPAAIPNNLGFVNTNAGTSSAVIWLQSNGADGATNNTIKDVNAVGNSNTTTLVGVGSGSSTISITSAGTGNNNNTFKGINVSKTQYGLYSGGASAANKNTGNVITQNLINTASPNNVATGGILVNFENGIQITQNDIGNLLKHDGTTGTTGTVFGIALGVVPSNTVTTFTGSDVINATVTRNRINALTQLNSTGYSSFGIVINSVTSGTTLVANNVLSQIRSASTASDFSAGIVAGGGTGSTTQIYFNSISMTGSRNAATFPSYGLAIGSGDPTIDVRDNIFYNTQTSSSTGKMYAIGTGSTTFANLTSNYNDFFVTGTSGFVGQTGGLGTAGTDRATLANWQTTTGKDANSISADPGFVSTSDLHISGTASPVNNVGTPGTGITNDFDNDTRDASTPDIGADEVITVAFSSATYSDAEDNTTTITVTRTSGSGGAASVNYATSDGTATGSAGSCFADYMTASGTLNFAAGETSKTFNVSLCDEGTFEHDETVNLTLSNATGDAILGSPATAVLTIINADNAPTVTISNLTQAEGNTGQTDFIYTLTKTGATAVNASVNYNTVSSGPIPTATFGATCGAGVDYIQTNGTVTFLPNETMKQITVKVCGDTTYEGDESYYVNINNGVDAIADNTGGNTTITNDDTAPTFAIDDVSHMEGNSGTTMYTFTVTKTGNTEVTANVDFTTVDGTATTVNGDYQANSGTLVFGAVDTTAQITVLVNGDTTFEPDEAFTVHLSNATAASITDADGTGTIQNDDAAPNHGSIQLSSATYNDDEADGINIVVTRTGGSDGAVAVTFDTSDGTATAGSDYTAHTGESVMFADGDAANKTIHINFNDDSEYEGPETFNVTLSNPTGGATLGTPASAVVTINDNDAIPATLVVNTTNDNDDGTCNLAHCSLREAINAANTNADASTINFNIPAGDTGCDGSGVCTITPSTSLPTITQPVTIDGYTQTGASANTLATGDDAALKIELNGTNAGASSSGLVIAGSNSTVRGLVINRFGTGGTFSGSGIYINGNNNTIEGCFIGTNPAGTAALPNTRSGAQIFAGSGNNIGGTSSGTTSAARNVISGNGLQGVELGDLSSGTIVRGNYIGTDKNGTGDLGNGSNGVYLDQTNNNEIGGVNAGEGNVISGNTQTGIVMFGSTNNNVMGNLIGVGADGTSVVRNDEHAITLLFSGGNNLGSNNNNIGDVAAGAGNTIANNGAVGSGGSAIDVDSNSTGNAIRGNSIHDNDALAIDLNLDGVTPNDTGDADTGANNLQNFPVITSATVTGSTKTIAGTFNSTAGQTFKLDFYTNTACDSSGFGEGQTYIGSLTNVATDGSGNASFTFHPTTLSTGQVVTATATDATGNTSEFSQCFTVTGGTAGLIEFTTATYSVAENVAGGMAAITVTRTGGTDGSITANFSTADGTATAGSDYTGVPNQAITYNDGESGAKTVFVSITDDSVYEGNETVNLSLSATMVNRPTEPNSPQSALTSATLTINENDAAPSFSINDVSHAEGNSGTTTYTFTVTKTGATALSSSVNFTTVDGTATVADNDYAANSGTLNFGAADTTMPITVLVNGDANIEPDEMFTVHLSNAMGATIADADGTGTIQNDDFANLVIVTPATTPTATDNDYTRINNAVQASFAGQTIKLLGTFDWTEANAAASWALGSDGQTGGSFSDDDYSIVPPAGLNNVTFTADNLGDAAIQGPGDLAAVNLEGVFAFFLGQNQGWTISNIRFLDFDLSIGMFASGVSDFNNTHITNNYIRIAKDLNATVAPADVNQNIGIHFSFGTNQVISGNTIEIQGDGISDGSNFATDVGMQSNTSGGAVYQGLQITNNTVRVLHAQNAANPQIVLGIWENAHAHTSNITVSGNQFVNMDAGNNASINLQRGFRVTSHSSATTTVKYENNSVSGANIGFQWLAGSNFAGNQPVSLKSNTIVNNATGVLVQSQGVANLSFNRIVGNSTTGVNNVDGIVTAENNWWGCNAGPGMTGCDGVTGTVDFDPWLVLGISASPSSIQAGGMSTITADMTHNSDGTDTSALGTLPPIPVSFGATNGTVNPPNATITNGQATTTFTSTSASNGTASATVDNQTVSTNIMVTAAMLTINDVFVSEPSAGTSTAQFTVTRSGVTTSAVTVDYATQDGTAMSAAGDYVAIPTTQLMFAPNETSKTISVTVNADAITEGNETFFVNLSNPSANATITDNQGQGTITDPVTAGQLLISEFRFRGPTFSAPQGIDGFRDEYVELYNNTANPITVATTDGSAGWTLASLNSAGTGIDVLIMIPNGTIIPARGHYLAVNSDEDTTNTPAIVPEGGYSLNTYAVGDAFYVTDIADNAGVAVFSTSNLANFNSATRLDSVGFNTGAAPADLFREGTALNSPGANDGQYAFVRRMETGIPQDTDNNAADFVFISPDGGTFGGVQSILGAPGPENCGCNPSNLFTNGVSPTQRNAKIKASLIDPQQLSTSPPNRVRDTTPVPNGALGTLELRRHFTNNTGHAVTRLRFRVVDITTLNTPNPGGAQADIRWLNSGNTTVTLTGGSMITLYGTVVETPPAQSMGGGLNSSGALMLPGNIAPGNGVDVRFVLGVQANGRFRFFINVEANTDEPPPTPIKPGPGGGKR